MNHLKTIALAATLVPGRGGRAPATPRLAPTTWLSAPGSTACAPKRRRKACRRRTIAAALDGVTFDQSIVARDRRQSVFSQTFLEFAGRMVNQNRLDHGANNLRKYASTFQRIEQQWGVPGPVIAAFWGLETDYGANIGDLPTINSLVAMAYDCRRPERFRGELIAALKIIERGDLAHHEMVGPWAGELGQLQFLPSHYYTYAVDFDGDGRRDLLRTAPDALASAANYMSSHRLACRRAVAGGGAGAARPAMGGGRYRHHPSAQPMGPVGREFARRPAAAAGFHARLAAAADGPQRPGLPRLSQFPRVPGMERVVHLCDHRGLFRHPARRRAARRRGQRPGRGLRLPGHQAAAGAAGAARLRRRRHRRHARGHDPRRRQGVSSSARAAGRLLSRRPNSCSG
jgi:membrane-bound lytic murein transglycosylase B